MPEAAAGPYLSDAQLSIFSPKPPRSEIENEIEFSFQNKTYFVVQVRNGIDLWDFFLISTPKKFQG